MIRVATIQPHHSGFGMYQLGEWCNPTSPDENNWTEAWEYADYVRDLHGGECEIYSSDVPADVPGHISERFADIEGHIYNLGGRELIAFKRDGNIEWSFEAIDITEDTQEDES